MSNGPPAATFRTYMSIYFQSDQWADLLINSTLIMYNCSQGQQIRGHCRQDQAILRKSDFNRISLLRL